MTFLLDIIQSTQPMNAKTGDDTDLNSFIACKVNAPIEYKIYIYIIRGVWKSRREFQLTEVPLNFA